MQSPVQAQMYCVLTHGTTEARCGGGDGASRRRPGPRRSWVERPYIAASVRWEHPYTDRVAAACLA
jgi:hypothetical protein